MDIKAELKKSIEEWVKIKKEVDEKQREYEEKKTVMNDMMGLIKGYMMILGDGNKVDINCDLNNNGKWKLQILEKKRYKNLSKKKLISLLGAEAGEQLWKERDKIDKLELKIINKTQQNVSEPGETKV